MINGADIIVLEEFSLGLGNRNIHGETPTEKDLDK